MKVGSLVVTIGDWTLPAILGKMSGIIINEIPVPDIVYTVRGITVKPSGTGITLEEVHNPITPHTGHEVHFDIDGFREVQPPIDVEAIVEDAIVTTQERELVLT